MTATLTEIALEVHICDQRRSYKAIFATEAQVLAFYEAHKSTHAMFPWDEDAADDIMANCPELVEVFWPTCPHGLSAWLCADPINHYPADL